MQKSVEYFSRLTTSQMMDDFERELGPAHLGAFYNWADNKHDNAFSKAATRMTLACQRRMENRIDELEYKREQATYFSSMTQLAERYRKEKGLDETRLFLDSLLG